MNFGIRLKQLRQEKGVQQIELARVLNISRQSVSNYENGTRFPSDETLFVKIAEFFDVSIDYLFGLTNIRKYSLKNEDIIIDKESEECYHKKQNELQQLYMTADNMSWNNLKKVNDIVKIINNK